MEWKPLLEQEIANVLAVLRELSRHENYDNVVPTPNPPASEQAILEYQQYLGCELPPSYRTFLRMHDGYRWLAAPGHMLAIADVRPGGKYWELIKEWKLGMAEVGLTEALDGIVIAYLDQPNNWVFLDPDRRSPDGELAIAVSVSGVDLDYHANLVEFLKSSTKRARMMLKWAEERAAKG